MNPIERITSSRGAWVSAGAFILLLLFFFRDPLLHKQPYFGIDMFEQAPVKLWMANEIGSGHLPLWNPYYSCGMPMAADGFTWGLYYPTLLLHLVFPAGFGFTIEALLHLLLAFYFIRKLLLYYEAGEAAAFFGGITFVFGAPTITTLYAGDIDILYAACWLPAIFYLGSRLALEGRHAAGLSVVLALQLLGGHAEITLFSFACSFLFVMAAGYQHWRKILLSYVCALGIGAVHLLPVAEVFTSYSMRNAYWTSRVESDQSFPISFLFSFLSPFLFGKQSDGTYWGPPADYLLYKYIGVVPLVLLVLACLKWKEQRLISKFMLIASFFLLLIAFGREGPFLLIADYLPIVRRFSVPANVMILFSFFASVVSALQWRHLSDRKNAWILAGFFLISVVGFAFIRLEIVSFHDRLFEISLITKQQVAFQQSLATWLVLSLCLVFFYSARRGALLILLQVFCLLVYTSVWVRATPLETYISANKWAPLMNDQSLYRVFEHESLPFTDKDPYAPLQQGAMDAIMFHLFRLQGGTTTLALKPYHEFKAFLNMGHLPEKDQYFFLSDIDSPLLRYLNVKYLLSSIPIENQGWQYIGKTSFYVYRSIRTADRAQLFHSYFVEPDPSKMLIRMRESYGLYLEQQGEKLFPVGESHDQVHFLHYSPNSIELETSSDTAGYLFLSEIYFPGWHASIDGQPAKLERANYTFRAIPISAGKHRVKLNYLPMSWIAGCAISMITILVLLGHTVWIKRAVQLAKRERRISQSLPDKRT